MPEATTSTGFRVRHLVDGRRRVTPGRHHLRTLPFDHGRSIVPVAGAGEALEFVAECGEGLARWLAMGGARRHDAISRFHRSAVARSFELAECSADDYGLSCEAAIRSIAHSQTIVDNLLVTPLRPMLDRGLHVVSLPGTRTGAHLAQSIWPLLLDGSTVMIRCSPEAPRTMDLLATIARDAGLPDGVVNIVYGWDDALEALALSPYVASVVTIGSHGTSGPAVAQASRVGKPTVTLHDPGS